MMTRLFLLILLCPAGALAAPLALDFQGTLGSGTVTGTFSYDPANVSTVNQNGWTNQIFVPTAWSFDVVNNWSMLPGTTFSSALAGQTAQWCQGTCLFTGSNQETLTLRDGTGLRLQLVFTSAGAFIEGDYRVEATRTPQSSLVSGVLTAPPASVPEPATVGLLLLGLGAIRCLTRRTEP